MIRIILLLAATVIAQEATSRRVVLPSGEIGYSVRCDNMTMNACYEKAGDVCFRGYDIQTEIKDSGHESTGGAYVGPGLVAGTSLGLSNSTSKSTSEKGLMIQCKDPTGTERERAMRHEAKAKKRLEEQERQYQQDREASRVVGWALGGLAILGIILWAVSGK